MSKLLIARTDAFTKAGRYVTKGEIISADEVDYDANDDKAAFIAAPSGVNENAVVEISAIAPTGPNPQNPQQIPNGTVQGPGGYMQGGARLVGEVTVPEKQRIEVVGIDKEDDTQSRIAEALEDANKADAEAAVKAAKADTAAARKEKAKA